jgi:hypothetical protein
MNILKTSISLSLSLFLLISVSSCKNDSESKVENKETTNTNTVNTPTSEGGDQFLVDTPEGYYEPKGLRKLNLMEMYELGSNPDFKKTFPLRDKDGRSVEWSIMEDPKTPMFMQMYVDDEGKIAEAVVFPITDEVKALIMKVRMVNK